MSTRSCLLYVVVLGALALNCAGRGARFFVDNGYDFDGLQTYDWILPAENDAEETDTIHLFQNKIEMQLEPRGYRKSSESPDFLISYHYDVKDRLGVIYYGSDFKSEEPYPFKEGSLVIEFVDPSSKAVFLHFAEPAIISKYLQPDLQEKRIDFAVNKMIAGLPEN